MKIVYESNSGHTEKYANMLAQKLNLKSIPLKQYKIDNEPIIFLGWLFANNIQGYKKVKDKANIKCTIAVGMTPTAKQNNSEIIKINNVNEKFFYLQGGVDYTKLKGIKKFKNKVQKLHFKFDIILRLCYNYICRRFGYG